MSSSAALPPMQTSMSASSCCRVMEYSSLSGSWLTIPRAWPRGTMVACRREKEGGTRAEAFVRAWLRGLFDKQCECNAGRGACPARVQQQQAGAPPRCPSHSGRALWMGLAPGV